METKHTKGEWSITGNEIRHKQRSILIATVYKHLKGNMPDEEQKANTKLIAAAPELLEALKVMFYHYSGAYLNEVSPRILLKAEQALKKATE